MEEKDKKYKQSIFTIGVTFKKLSLCDVYYFTVFRMFLGFILNYHRRRIKKKN